VYGLLRPLAHLHQGRLSQVHVAIWRQLFGLDV
jgi:hypothetical protein